MMRSEDEVVIITKGPWTEEEDSVLFSYITIHGEGHWNSVARCAGLNRTGKSCRLRWLNYLRPSVRRGNMTLQEQLLILQLHCRWGNRWSKIAKELPGRTDNEIKNYWRTRVVKQAKQLKCDVNSQQFRDTLRFVWMPRMLERIQVAAQASGSTTGSGSSNPSGTLLPESSSSSTSTTESCNNLFDIGGGGNSFSSYSAEEGSAAPIWHQRNHLDFGGVDLWTDENISFLQQQLNC